MERICGSTFWDTDLTWNISDPYFTSCFEETVFIWTPPGILIALSALNVAAGNSFNFGKRSNGIKLKWTTMSIIRSIISVILACVSITAIQFFQNHDAAMLHVLALIIRFAGYVLVLVLLVFRKHSVVMTSVVVQDFFWSLSFICEGILFRTALTKYNESHQILRLVYTVRFIMFPLVSLQFVLHCFADRGESLTKAEQKANETEVCGKSQGDCLEHNESFCSRLLYAWFDDTVLRGSRKPLEFTDLREQSYMNRTKTLYPIFKRHWDKEMQNATSKSLKTGLEVNASILIPLFKFYWKPFIVAGIVRLAQDLLPFFTPKILKLLLAHFSKTKNAPNPEDAWKGYLYGVALILCSLITTILGVQHNKRMLRIGMMTKSVLSSAVYRKSLNVSNSNGTGTSNGEVINLIGVDIQRLMELATEFHLLWTAPIQIALSLYFLHSILGVSILAGVAVIVFMFPLNGLFTMKQKTLQREQMRLKDERVKLIGEFLAEIKTLKLYAWDTWMQRRIEDVRTKEVGILKKIMFYSSASMFFFNYLPLLMTLATFATNILTDPEHTLDAERTFVSLSLFNIMKIPMVILPSTIGRAVQSIVSISRIGNYLTAKEVGMTSITHTQNDGKAIMIADGNFSWNPPSITLKDINLTLTKGSLTAVVGSVGSGKTSLLSSILGDIPSISGDVTVNGSVAYVSQEHWIRNGTFKDNILFCDVFRESKYTKVLEACSLSHDLSHLDAGDGTVLEERGSNISVGQKQRISLARAAYKESDIYLLDDPLSSVDATVGNHIFHNLIGPCGILSNKTRVLVTNEITWLPKVDNIVVLESGRIVEIGTFESLMHQEGSNLAHFMTTCMKTNTEGTAHSIGKTIVPARGMPTANMEQTLLGKPKLKTQEEQKPSKTSVNEKAEVGMVKWNVLADYCKACKWSRLLLGLVAILTQVIFATYSNIWLARWSGDYTDAIGKHNRRTSEYYLGGYAVIGLLQCVAVLLGAIVLGLATLNAAALLHRRILTKLTLAPMSFFNISHSGRLINVFSKDIDVLDSLVPVNLIATLTVSSSVVSLFASISYSTPIFIAFIVPVMALCVWLQRFYIATSRQLRRIESVSRSPIYSMFNESMTGSTIIRAFEKQDYFISEIEDKIDSNQMAYYSSIAATMWINIRLEFIGALVILMSTVIAVLARDEIDPATAGLSVTSALAITAQLKFLVKQTSELETNIVSAERVYDFNNIAQESPSSAWKILAIDNWPCCGKIEFQKYDTRYGDGLGLVLKGITCQIDAGEKIGVVGRTGAGKSSLSQALFRLLEPVSGSIHIDGIDITNVGIHDLRSRIAIIPQEAIMLSGTLRMNLDPFEVSSDEDIFRALECAGLKRHVDSQPKGLFCDVEEGGVNFSVGQRQLVSLVRALIRPSKIIIMDEATAALDVETADVIHKAVQEEFRNATVITIAHRLMSVLDSTRIMVMQDGAIVEFDTPSNLIANPSSEFSQMMKSAGSL